MMRIAKTSIMALLCYMLYFIVATDKWPANPMLIVSIPD